MRHYAHNIGDYAAATGHLSWLEDCAYRRLLDLYYQTERPLSADENELLRRVNATTKRKRDAVRAVLQEFFTRSQDGCWHQRRVDKELNAFKKMAEGGRIGGLKARAKGRASPTHPTTLEPTTTHYPLPTTHEEESPPSHAPHERARVRGSERDPGIEEFEPEGNQAPDPATVKSFLRRHLQQQPIPPGWSPSATAIQKARAARPDLTDEQISYRTGEFLSWCAETNKTTFSAEDTWLNFVRKTDVSKSPGQGDEFDDPGTRAIAAAVARRYPNG